MKFLACLLCSAALLIADLRVTKLTPEEFVVNPSQARSWNFRVPSGGGRVGGGFRASGGARNDIRMLIAEETECVNYLNGNQAQVQYDSGQKSIGKFDVALGEGGYCIIFDNRTSLISVKEVASRIYLGVE